MIISKEARIKAPEKLTSEYIENELKKQGLDVLRWAIVSFDGEYYTIETAAVL